MKTSQKKQLYRLYTKKFFKQIPQLLLIQSITAIIVLCVFLFAAHLYGDESFEIKIGYVATDDSKSVKKALSYLSSNLDCEFEKYDTAETRQALNDLEKNKLLALLITENEGTDSLSELKIKFIYNDNSGFITEMFGNLIKAALIDYSTYTVAQNTFQSVYINSSDAETEILQELLMQYLIQRNRNYERLVFSSTGDLPLKHLYLGSGLTFFVLISVSVIIFGMKKEDENFCIGAKRMCITDFDIFLARYFPLLSFYVILSLLGYCVFSFTNICHISLHGILLMVITTLLVILFICNVCDLFTDKVSGFIAGIVISVLFMFISGNIIPLSFLPESVHTISGFLPTKWIARAYGHIFMNQTDWKMTGVIAIWLLLTILFAACIQKIKMEHSNVEFD